MKTETFTFQHITNETRESEGFSLTREDGVVYLVSNEGNPPWLAEFFCPCGCGDRVMLPLVPGGSPRWTLNAEAQTLNPSINRVHRCKAHFFIRNGKVIWC